VKLKKSITEELSDKFFAYVSAVKKKKASAKQNWKRAKEGTEENKKQFKKKYKDTKLELQGLYNIIKKKISKGCFFRNYSGTLPSDSTLI